MTNMLRWLYLEIHHFKARGVDGQFLLWKPALSLWSAGDSLLRAVEEAVQAKICLNMG